MQIHRVRGRNVREALELARERVGDDALVVGRESDPAGGVLLAVTRRSPEAAPAPVIGRTSVFEREVAERLRRQGASEALVDTVATEVHRLQQAEGDPRHVIDVAADAISNLFTIAKAPVLRGATRPIAFVGATGVGKSTALAKFALRLVRAGRRVGIATLDTHRVGAVEGLRAAANLLGTPFFPLHGAPDFAREDLRASGLQVLLIDTSGRPARDREGLARLAQALGTDAIDIQLVLPATASRAALESAHAEYAEPAPAGVVITRLDQTDEPAGVLEHVLETGLPLAFFGDGPDVENGLHRAAPDLFADVLLRGSVG